MRQLDAHFGRTLTSSSALRSTLALVRTSLHFGIAESAFDWIATLERQSTDLVDEAIAACELRVSS